MEVRAETTKQLDPELYLHHVLERIADHPVSRIHELLSWNVASCFPRISSISSAHLKSRRTPDLPYIDPFFKAGWPDAYVQSAARGSATRFRPGDAGSTADRAGAVVILASSRLPQMKYSMFSSTHGWSGATSFGTNPAADSCLASKAHCGPRQDLWDLLDAGRQRNAAHSTGIQHCPQDENQAVRAENRRASPYLICDRDARRATFPDPRKPHCIESVGCDGILFL